MVLFFRKSCVSIPSLSSIHLPVTDEMLQNRDCSEAMENFFKPHYRRRDEALLSRFTGTNARLIKGGVGHNLPQEAPEAFAKAIIGVDAFNDISSL